MPFLKVQDQITYIQLQHCPASKLVPCRLRRYELENQAYSCSGSPVVVKGEPLQGTRKTRNWAKKEFTRQKCRRRQITSNHITYSTVSSASNLQHFNEPRPIPYQLRHLKRCCSHTTKLFTCRFTRHTLHCLRICVVAPATTEGQNHGTTVRTLRWTELKITYRVTFNLHGCVYIMCVS